MQDPFNPVNDASRRLGRFRSRIVHYLAIVAFGVWAAVTFRDEMMAQPVTSAAAAISDGRMAAADDLARAIEVESRLQAMPVCRADILRGLGAIELAASADQDKRVNALARADAFFRQSLACAPWQGNAWLVLAQIRHAREGYDAQTRDFIDKSYRFAPREGWISIRRIALEASMDNELMDARLARFNQAVQDLAVAPDWRDLVELYRNSATLGQQRILAALDGAPSDAKGRFHFHVLWKR